MLARMSMSTGILLRLIPSALLIAVASAAPTIEVAPARVVEGESVLVRLTGLEAEQTVVLHAMAAWERYPAGLEPYRSRATFRADQKGVVDLGRDAPQASSSYTSADSAGIFWSMVADRLASPPLPGAPSPTAAAAPPSVRGEVRLELEIGGNVVARQTVHLATAAEGVAVREVREAGVTGVFAAGPSEVRRPAVIVLGGSEGGLFTARGLAPLLASQGYAVLGLGYFRGGETNLTALPPTLELIPVETLAAARAWLAAQPGVDVERLAVIGVSKGAEFALVAATVYPWIDAVAAFAPSHVVWEGIPPDGAPRQPRASSWTREGRPLDFVRWSYPAEERNTAARKASGRARLTEPHLESLAIHAADTAAARIPVERASASLLLVAGIDDGMWPAAYSVAEIAAAARAGRSDRIVEVEILSTGHQVLGTGWAPTTTFNRPRGRLQGGSPELDARAQSAAWARLRQFLAEQLGKNP